MMVRKLVHRAIALCLAASICTLLCVGDAAADVIYLKNGNIIRGMITEQTDSVVKVKFGSRGEVTFSPDEIHAIQTNELDYKPLGTDRAAAAETGPAGSIEGTAEPATPPAEPLTAEDQTALDESLAKLRTDDPAKWQEAENVLARMGPKVFGRLEQALGTAQHAGETAFLMSAMARVDAKRAVGPITAKAADTNEMSRQAAVIMLGEIGDRRGVDTLVEALGDNKYYVRRDAADALGKIADRKAVPALVRAARDNDPEVKRASMDALRKITKVNLATGKEWYDWWKSQSGDSSPSP